MTTVEPTLALLDPASLLVDLNIREAMLDKDFVASVKDHGVLEPIVAVRTDDGAVRVRHGHRRALAAIEAGRNLVPVYIAGTEDNDDADRIARQWHENQHRAALTNVEEVAAVDQLALLGLSAATIAKRLRSPRKHVDNALSVRGSDLARAATARYHFLTLEQSAVIADFDADPEAVKALVAAAQQGDVQFQRAAQTAHKARERAAGRAALRDTLTDAGMTVLDGLPDYRLRLDSLRDTDGAPLDATTHASCPGHAAYLVEDWIQTVLPELVTPESTEHGASGDANGDDADGDDDADEDNEEDDAGWQLAWVPVYACTDPVANGHQSRYGSGRTGTAANAAGADSATLDAAKEAARQERRTTLANNKAWREVEPIRREWLRALATRKTAPKGAAGLVAAAVTLDSYTIRKAMETPVPLAANLLGLDSSEAIATAAAEAGDARALLITLIVVLAAHEHETGVHSWRSASESTRYYFGWLADSGYPLSEVEALAGPRTRAQHT